MDLNTEIKYLKCLNKLKNGDRLRIFIDNGGYVIGNESPYTVQVYVIGNNPVWPGFLLMGTPDYISGFGYMDEWEISKKLGINNRVNIHGCANFLWYQYPYFLIKEKILP